MAGDFEPHKAVFNFPFNASTPEVEEWLTHAVMAFRTGGPAIGFERAIQEPS